MKEFFSFRRKKVRVIMLLFFITVLSSEIFAQLVTNGSFENTEVGIYSDNEINGWVIQVASVNPAPVFEIINDEAQDGNNALKVSVDGTGENQWDIQIVADSIPAVKDVKYYLSVWAKADAAGAQASITVGNYDYTEYGAIRPADVTTEWKEYKLTFTVNDDITVMRVPLHFSFSGNSGKVIYIDNLEIKSENYGKTPIIVEAEDGEIGSDFVVEQDGDITYVTTTQNSSTWVPEDPGKMIIYQVTFPDSGYYNLFARLNVGSDNFDDDSFIASRGFNVESDTASADWVMVNGLASAGFTAAEDVVNDLGTIGSQVWKWVNISKNFYAYDQAQDSLYVGLDSLTKTFKIASREDGLKIDKLAFGKSYLLYTVDALDNELPGVISVEKPDTSHYYQGPPLADGLPKFLGNIRGTNDIHFNRYWNQLTPGNEGKWGSIAYSIDTTAWNWSGLDALYNFAKENGMIFKNHTLVWGSQQPSWIDGLEKEEQLKYIETWIRMVGARYPDMDMIDVVNEALPTHNPPDGKNKRANYKDALGGDGETGYDWVITAFELARKYIPQSKLILNDYGIINDPVSTSSYLKIINLLNERGLIDGIGVQGHRFEFENASTSTLTSNLNRLAETGLPIYISEMDLGNYSDSGTPSDDTQLNLYKKIFPVVWEHSGVKGITLWGYLEGQMWQTTCHLVHTDWTWRPAMSWLVDYMKDYKTDVEDVNVVLPAEFSLEQNYPNPFNPTTNITFNIAKSSKVALKVFDMLGREIATLVNTVKSPGKYTIEFNAHNLPSGIYFYQLRSGEFTATKKLMLLK